MRPIHVSFGLAAVALALTCAPAWAHPHGGIDCRAAVRMAGAQVQAIDAELRLDAAHSAQALQLVRDPATDVVDPRRLSRLAFALKLQLGRLGWLFDLTAGGEPVALTAGEPQVQVAGEEVRVRVALALTDGRSPAAAHWTLRCGDPSFYWVTAFGAMPAVGGPQPRPASAAVALEGCCGSAVAGDAPAGTAAVRWQCAGATAFGFSETAIPN